MNRVIVSVNHHFVSISSEDMEEVRWTQSISTGNLASCEKCSDDDGLVIDLV